MKRGRLLWVFAALWGLLASGCASALRERVTPFPLRTPRAVPWELNRELLMPVNRRILIVVELVEGHVPEREALDTLARVAGQYGERPASWVALGYPGAPRIRFGPSLSIRGEGALEPDTTYIVVRYVGRQISNWGLSFDGYVNGRAVYVILINQEKHRNWKGLLPERHLEAQTLVHEYGHHLGLPTPDHGFFPQWPYTDGGSHCVNPDCALALPRLRTLLYGFPHAFLAHQYLEDYCAQCRAAIAAAKKYWRAELEQRRPLPLPRRLD